MINGSLILIAAGAYAAYKLACALGETMTTDRENGSES